MAITTTVTITAKQLAALKAAFGADADIPATVQRLTDTWIVQYERMLDDNERQQLKVALDSAPVNVKAQVKTLLGLEKTAEEASQEEVKL